MINLNRASIIGNCTRDPEMRYTPNGQGVTSFSVATNRRWTKDGEDKEEVEFHNIVAWGRLAEIAHQLLKKGARVYIEGRLQTRSWEGQDGVSRQRTEIISESIIALTPKGEGSYTPSESTKTKPVEDSAEPEKDTKKDEKKTPASEDKKTSSTDNKKEDEVSAPAKAKEDKKDDEEIDIDDIPF
ncbi:MAG: single-stranded DNA-binding protein [bacterium]